ncbi:hypothetical protein AVEN_37613-1 [Araneus ventricosus]|uniref:Uncharacterized protein n=1 Tax=Araneus ventricosus TaxID=182803 RepID=A0A4Y2SIJ0_ARAVE|nr:hypothetical protein AVEN_37613-1 [Araneus ventricosus]
MRIVQSDELYFKLRPALETSLGFSIIDSNIDNCEATLQEQWKAEVVKFYRIKIYLITRCLSVTITIIIINSIERRKLGVSHNNFILDCLCRVAISLLSATVNTILEN